MMFELHITVDSTNVDKWGKLCQRLKMEPVLIFLTRGKYPVQMMCIKNFASSADEANSIVKKIEEEVIKDDFKIMRTKLEGSLNNKMNDISERLTCALPPYSECHTKILIPSSRRSEVLELERKLGLFASINVLNNKNNEQSGNSLEKWYFNSRKYSDLEGSRKTYQEEFREIKKQFPNALMEMECVFIDTNPDIDSGWIEAK
jgi:chromosome segregation ATPase